MRTNKTFLWHDYETFGTNPAADRPVQFAAIRTDEELEPVGDPRVWYCSPADDVLPQPQACLVTGITPQQARMHGECEAIFARRIHEEMMQPGTCSAGYNSLRFDDVFTRNLFYRNLRDAYEREYKHGNSRWDLIDLTRMCFALRPDGIEWPAHEDGKPSFRLEDLTRANGIEHSGAHDALADVQATLELARLLRRAQPRLFEWGLRMRDSKTVAGLVDPAEPNPLLHSSARIPALRGCTTLVLPLAVHPQRPKAVVVFDLASDPEPLLSEPADVIHDLVFTPSADMPDGVERLPLKLVQSNHVPMLAPLGTLRGVDCERIGLDQERCLANARRLIASLPSVREKVASVFAHGYSGIEETSDPDRALYSGGFFSPADRHLLNKILSIAPADLGKHLWSFQDERLQVMLFRYRARNYPDTLNLEERRLWNQDRKHRLVETEDPAYFTVRDLRESVASLRSERKDDPGALEILDQIESWIAEIGLDDL
jgi:exodeoxyribonuclease-1